MKGDRAADNTECHKGGGDRKEGRTEDNKGSHKFRGGRRPEKEAWQEKGVSARTIQEGINVGEL